MNKEQSNISTVPVMGYSCVCACHITREAFLKAYEIYVEKHGGNKSPDKIIEQGGFTEEELDMLFPVWINYIIETI